MAQEHGRALPLDRHARLRCNVPSVATAATATHNGNGRATADDGMMLALETAFRDRHLSFRHAPHAKCAELRWQAGRTVFDDIGMPDGTIVMLARFELVEWGASAGPVTRETRCARVKQAL